MVMHNYHRGNHARTCVSIRDAKARVGCPCRNSKCKYYKSRLAQLQDHAIAGDVARDKETSRIRNDAPKAAILRAPIGPDFQLSSQLVSLINNLQLGSDWTAFVPSRIGQNETIDRASRAVAAAYQSLGQKDDVIMSESYNNYSAAMTRLRSSLDLSDTSLMTVALLFLFECIMGTRLEVCAVHQRAMTAILLARSKTTEISDFARAVLQVPHSTFGFAIASGEPSPFEEERWFNLEFGSATATAIPAEMARFLQLTYQRFLRLPRLIARVRALIDGQEGASVDVTMDLAQQAMTLEDTNAENAVLHRVKVVETIDLATRAVVRYSFNYRALFEHRTAVQCWESRLLFVNLCIKLLRLPSVSEHYNEAHPCPFDMTELAAEQRQLLTNIFMSVQYGFANGPFGLQAMPQAFIACWGALALMSDTTFRNVPIDFVRSYVLQTAPLSFGSWFDQSTSIFSKDLDELSNIFQGGPIKGHLIQRYRGKQT